MELTPPDTSEIFEKDQQAGGRVNEQGVKLQCPIVNISKECYN